MKSGYEKFFQEAQRASGLDEERLGETRAPQKNRPTPRETAVEKLRRNQRRRALGRRKPFPLYPVLSTGALFALVAVAYHYSDHVDELLSKVEVGFLGQANAKTNSAAGAGEKAEPEAKAAEKAAEKSAGEEKKTAKDAATNVAEKPTETLNVKQWTPEELSFFSKLSDRKKELDLREAELVKLEEELQKRKVELDEKLKALEAMRADISKTLKSRVATDQGKVDKLVQVYSSMKAAQAAKVIETLNEDLAVEVLDKMKKKSAAEILDMMNAKKARRLSELLTGYERTPAAQEAEEAGADTAAAGPAMDATKPEALKK